MVIRPLRVLGKDGGGVEARGNASAHESALAVESGEMPSELGTLHGAVADSTAVAAAQRIENDSLTARRLWQPESLLTQSRSVATLVEDDLDDVPLGQVSVETAAENVADEELIAASLAEDAQTRILMAIPAVLVVIWVAVLAIL